MIDQHHPIPQGKGVQAARCQRKLLMGCQHPNAHPGEAELQVEKARGALGEGQGQSWIRLLPPLVYMAQRAERIQERAPKDQQREHHRPAREPIDIGIVALPRPPKACASAPPAERTPERRGARPTIRHVAPFERWFVPWGYHGRCDLPEVLHG